MRDGELTQQEQPVLQVRNLSKSFPGVQALDGVDLDVTAGQVHALTGENGAGKSTLMKVLIAIHAPDSGEIRFQGQVVHPRNPHDAQALGISMIHQELMPFPDLTVAENIFMGREPTKGFPGWIDRPAMNRDAQSLLDRLGLRLPPERRMKELTVAEMQVVEIAKAMAQRSAVIIMDEPTSAISDREVEALFALIQDLKKGGVAVIYISHRMEEVFRIADVVTVLRDGRHVATLPTSELDENKVVSLMVGRELKSEPRTASAPAGETVLAVKGLGMRGKFSGVDLTLRRGEIVGLAGLMGAGRTDLVSAIAGLRAADEGEILVGGTSVRIRNPGDAIRHGIAMVSEDRKLFGLVPAMSVEHNVTLASLRRCSKGLLIDHAKERQVTDEQIRAFSIKTPDRNRRVEYLSGGNQQKVVIAKALLTEPDVLILDEPTRGIDVGAKAEIYGIMRRLASAGMAIIMVSSEMEEILSLSDRILVMREGAVTAELDPRETSAEEILKWAMPG